jgi:predicted alpha/beta superfamily hydrolase
MKTFQVIAIIALLLFSSILMQAQNGQTQSKQIVIGTKDIIHSKILNEQREIWVYVPSSASDTTFSKQRYPVVYLLDGDDHFSSVVGMIQQLSSAYVCPEMIVVGIPNTYRTRDLTPTHMNSWQFLNFVADSDFCKTSGGGEKFISFIEKELMPHIDSLFPTAPYRMFIGHSFGGLTIINALVHHTALFNAYVAIDPAMSWDNQKLLKESKKALANNDYSGVSLFLGIANTMPVGMDTIKVKKDTNKSTEHIRSIFELRNYLSSNKQNQLKYAWKYYNNDEHNSVPLNAEYDALRFIFNYYHVSQFYNDYKNIEHLFENVTKQFGYKVKPPEGLVNSLAYFQLIFKRFEDALYLFKLNISNYPDSWNAYDSLGDYYAATGDKAKAIDNYKKVLSLKEIPDTRKKLDALQSK